MALFRESSDLSTMK